VADRFAIAGGTSCDGPTTYALDTSDELGAAGVIATINHCGEAISTQPARWKCSKTCDDGWEMPSFDDSKWDLAADAGTNGIDPWGHQDVGIDAHWIWAADIQSGDDIGREHDSRRACCRYVE
jgi:hypothetical protein